MRMVHVKANDLSWLGAQWRFHLTQICLFIVRLHVNEAYKKKI